MDKLEANECLLVSVDFTKGEDIGILIVGRQKKRKSRHHQCFPRAGSS